MVNPHGGDLIWAKTKYSGEILDFSVNCNPLGTPPSVLAAAADALSRVGQYPRPGLQRIAGGHRPAPGLRRRGNLLRQRRGGGDLPPGAGHSPRRSPFDGAHLLGVRIGAHPSGLPLPLPPPSAGGGLRPHGADSWRHHPRPPGRLPLYAQQPHRAAHFPGASLYGAPAVRRSGLYVYLLTSAPVPGHGRNGLAPLVKDHPKLVVLRAFTKSYAVPSLRLGYCVADPGLVEKLHRWGGCWNGLRRCPGGGTCLPPGAGLAGAGTKALRDCPPGASFRPRGAGVHRGARQRQLSPLPPAGGHGSQGAGGGAGHFASQLRQLPRLGRGLLPGGGAMPGRK